MKKYTVELHATKEVAVEAESILKAVKIAQEQTPGFTVQGIYDGEEWVDIDQCNGCGEYFTDSDDTGSDSDGNSYCKDCFGAAKEDYLLWLGNVVDAAKLSGVKLRDDRDEDYIETLNELYGEHSEDPGKAVEYLIKHEMVLSI